MPQLDVTAGVRRHGFQWPFHPFQILSWVVFTIDVVMFVIFSIPLLDAALVRALVNTAYACSVLVLVIATFQATICDPVDRFPQHAELKDKAMEQRFYCEICSLSVYARSKHCHSCNKCIGVFDHHCMWLNNCIGERNYRPFIFCIVSVAVMTGLVTGMSLYVILDYWIDTARFEERFQDEFFLSTTPLEVVLTINGALLFVNFPLLTLDLQLVILHIFLRWQGVTTWEYILRKRDQESVAINEATSPPPKVVSLPRCLDWIVFARCGRRRRKKNKIETIGAGNDASLSDMVESALAAADAAAGCYSGSQPAITDAWPPGSTMDTQVGVDSGSAPGATAHTLTPSTSSTVESTSHGVGPCSSVGEATAIEVVMCSSEGK